MTPVFIVGIVFGSFVLALAIIGGTILAIIRTRHGGISRKNRKEQAEEVKMIQEIFQGLSRMQQRVDTLETILMDHKEKGNER
jgi:phage shock protein B